MATTLSELLNAMPSAISLEFAARGTLERVERGGWQGVFGPVEVSGIGRLRSLP
jgi:hypothetical protein